MTTKAHVKQLLPDGKCEIFVARKSSCGESCKHCGGCGADGQTMFAVAANEAGARVGDLVEVESANGEMLGAAATVYLLPVLLMIAGYLIADGNGLPSQLAILSAIGGFAAGMVVAILLSRSKRRKTMLTVRRVVRRKTSRKKEFMELDDMNKS